MENIHKKLSEIWLKENEISIYLCSLSYWTLPASVLWQKTNIARSNAQYICQKLIEKWLLSVLETPKGNIYSPEPPSKIITLLNREYDKLDEKIEQAKAIVPFLEWYMKNDISVSNMKFYKWVDGIIDMFEDVLNDKNDVCGFLYFWEDMSKKVFSYLQENYIPKRKKYGIKAKSIFNKKEGADDIITQSPQAWREVVLIDYDLYPIDACIQVYWDKVAFYSYKNNDLTGMIIKNEHISSTQLSLFNMVWNLWKKIWN